MNAAEPASPALAWMAAGWRGPARLRARLRRHPFAVDAHFDACLTLTYALPAEALRRLLPPGLELETRNGAGFVAVAAVRARGLRPAGMPVAFGQDFFLTGYRVFARFRAPSGRWLRGLRILRSDADSLAMVVVGNVLTHYNYRRCAAVVDTSPDRLRIGVRTPGAGGDLEVRARLDEHTLPASSPFGSIREAMRFAGPLPFTFDYEPETHAIVAIEASRCGWHPTAVAVEVERIAFFDQPAFHSCTPVLAAGFFVRDIDYHWKRGVCHAL